jgi:hypothetical protein
MNDSLELSHKPASKKDVKVTDSKHKNSQKQEEKIPDNKDYLNMNSPNQKSDPK